MHTRQTRLLDAVRTLISYHKNGQLQGEAMPEDANPRLLAGSEEELCYFTLPMALNFQRDSYRLWQSALQTYHDPQTNFLFYPELIIKSDLDEIRAALLKYKLALQPNKHVQIWTTLCETLCNDYGGSLLNLFSANDFDIKKILHLLHTNKKKFPYLAGPKISNYWLYVLTQYTPHRFKNLAALSIAPDTHVMQASVRLGLATQDCSSVTVAAKWFDLLATTDIAPIEVHTPLWLWSRQGFKPEIAL